MTAFTEADIRAGANSQSYERGSSYYRSGAVADVVRRGNLLTARVSGSDHAPYEIAITLLDGGRISTTTRPSSGCAPRATSTSSITAGPSGRRI